MNRKSIAHKLFDSVKSSSGCLSKPNGPVNLFDGKTQEDETLVIPQRRANRRVQKFTDGNLHAIATKLLLLEVAGYLDDVFFNTGPSSYKMQSSTVLERRKPFR
ncbi:hypothetical protein CSKR_201227 [Clonorchis sinensis]|uniref:Uncharacterized protein n=1 Tax=Clonorchis sinensis TaxID=79923 RepID=A0A8T1MN22_CLOSI|nr:hypothetical protein CSKR_201227 [Clonorchis sinensis]